MRCFLFGLLLLASMARTQAAEEKPSPPTTKTLYSDKSWTHKPLVIEVVSGNAAGDVDDQELGQFILELSEAEVPKPQMNEAKEE